MLKVFTALKNVTRHECRNVGTRIVTNIQKSASFDMFARERKGIKDGFHSDEKAAILVYKMQNNCTEFV